MTLDLTHVTVSQAAECTRRNEAASLSLHALMAAGGEGGAACWIVSVMNG